MREVFARRGVGRARIQVAVEGGEVWMRTALTDDWCRLVPRAASELGALLTQGAAEAGANTDEIGGPK